VDWLASISAMRIAYSIGFPPVSNREYVGVTMA
jgi:hypothetical protein